MRKQSIRTQNERQRAEIFNTVYGAYTTKEITELFRADYIKVNNDKQGFDEVISLFPKYVLAITFLYSISSIKNNLKIFRKVIKEEGGIWRDTAKSSFYIYDVYKVVSDNTDEKLDQKEQNQKDVQFDTTNEIARVKNMLDRKSYHVASNQNVEQVRSYHLAYILGLSTGRRFTEIFKTVTIHSLKKGQFFRGILKKESNQKNELEANLIGLSVHEARKYTKELRTYLNAKLKDTRKQTLAKTTENQINTIFSKVYNNAVKRISGDKIPNFHELRHYYAIEGTEIFRRNGESDKDVRYRILGHHVRDDTTRTYSTIK